MSHYCCLDFPLKALLLYDLVMNVFLEDLQLLHVFVKQRVFYSYELVLWQGLPEIQRVLLPHRDLKILRTNGLHNAFGFYPKRFTFSWEPNGNYLFIGHQNRL